MAPASFPDLSHLSTDRRGFFRKMKITRTNPGQPKALQRYGFVSSLAGAIAMAVGGLVLVGWLFGVRALASVMPDYTTMKPNTAVCLVLAGLSLWLLRFRSNQGVEFNPEHRRFGQICAVLVAFLGLFLDLDRFILDTVWRPCLWTSGPGTELLSLMALWTIC